MWWDKYSRDPQPHSFERWSKDYDQPHLLYGLRNDVLLVGQVYLCRNKHQILSRDQGILCQLRAGFQPPFLLFHKIGATRELFRFFTSHISAGMTISDVQVLWHQSLFDEYGVRISSHGMWISASFLSRSLTEFTSPSPPTAAIVREMKDALRENSKQNIRGNLTFWLVRVMFLSR